MTDTIKISRELMPCPHCNGSAEMRLYDCEYFVQCVECFASTVADFQIEDEAAQAWNRRATPPADAADMGGQAGEEVEVMAYAVDHPEAGYKVYKQFSQWMNGGEWRCDSLMTVAQHQRIVAAISAQQSEPERVSVPRELLVKHLREIGEYAWEENTDDQLRALLNGGEA